MNSFAKADPSPGSRHFTKTNGYIPSGSGWTSIGATQDWRQHPDTNERLPNVNKSDGVPYPQGPAGEFSKPPPLAQTGRGDGREWFSLSAASGFKVVAPLDTPSADKAWPKTYEYPMHSTPFIRKEWKNKPEGRDPALVAQAIGASNGFGLSAGFNARPAFVNAHSLGPRKPYETAVAPYDSLLDAAMMVRDQQKAVSSPPGDETTVEAQKHADVLSGRGINRVAQSYSSSQTTGLPSINETAAQGTQGWFSLSASRPRAESVPGAIPDVKNAPGAPRNMYPSSDEVRLHSFSAPHCLFINVSLSASRHRILCASPRPSNQPTAFQ
jgi:hypothetical protein